MAINFSAQFIVNEKTSTRVLRLTDTSTGFTLSKGNFIITFPDGSVASNTDFASPQISAPGGNTSISLIIDTDNTVLTGTYIINYVALNTALNEFTKTETFDFNWEKPTKAIINDSDVVLPEVQFKDLTAYETSGSFTGVLTRNFFTTTPSTSEVGVITKTSAGDILTPSNASKYYEGIYLVRSDISVLYTHTSKSWLTVSYVDLLQETYDVREAPTQDELVALINTYKNQIEEYKTTNPSQYEILNEQYDLVLALYSHILARYQTNTLDGSKAILDQLLGLLPPASSYTYKATMMLPFTINFTTSLTGTGTIGTISKFTGTASIGDSIIKEDNNRIGIGKTPTTTLDVNGTIQGTSIVKSGGTSSQFLKADGSVDSTSYQLTLTNPITGTGTTNYLPKFTGATAIGNSNIQDSGTLITLGSNTTISSGGLGIGTVQLTGYNLRVSKSITGAVTAYGVLSEGTIQSDVTTTGYGYRSSLGTVASAFTVGTVAHFAANQATFGAGSAVTNQVGFLANGTLTGATNNYGFQGQVSAATNSWNLYMTGTANNYLAGSLGIGTTSLTGYNLRIGKAITGATVSYGVMIDGTIQSDVTADAFLFRTNISTQAASFNLSSIQHFRASQATLGAGSAVGVQTGFFANSSLVGAVVNYGFRGSIPAQTGAWNIYMDGTAQNYLAGDTTIGTTASGTATKLTVGGSITAVSAIARGQLINPSLVASANSDVLVGLDIAPTFTNGAFTGVANMALRFSGTANNIINSLGDLFIQRGGLSGLQILSTNTHLRSIVNTSYVSIGLTTTEYFRVMANTGNVSIQNGGTFTDVASSRLTINSTTQGFLPPRMTETQRTAIATPAEGLIVVQTDGTQGLYIYISAAWHAITML
jgi:hypothetical protein